MTFGEDNGWGASVAESESMLDHYLDHGGNFIDTANIYTNGHSEKIIGDYFATRAAARDRVVIGTKFYCTLFPGDPNGGGAGRKAIIQQCEESLRRLQMDYVDIYWLHNWDRTAPIDETLRALDDLVRAGKIRYLGFSDVPAWKTAEAQTIAQFSGFASIIALQLEYSLLERTPEGELLPMADEMGMGAMAWSPLKSGFLSGKYRRDREGEVDTRRTSLVGEPSEADYVVIEALHRVAKEADLSPASVALAWVQSQPAIAATLIGARTLDQLRANLAAGEVELTERQVATLAEVSTPKLNFPADNNRTLAPILGFADTTIDGTTMPPSGSLSANSTRY
jgi:aryl-alcohol dehydrogenase-like predicted oxidoreductase